MIGSGFIWMLLSWGGVILLAVWLITVLFPTGPQPSSGNISDSPGKARHILDQRYARGELSQTQCDEIGHAIDQ